MRKLTATLCLTIAVLLGSVGMSASGDFKKGAAAYKSGDYATALREWTPLAEQGNAPTQFIMGVMYQYGNGVPKNEKTAVKWYRLAVKQGNANAQVRPDKPERQIAEQKSSPPAKSTAGKDDYQKGRTAYNKEDYSTAKTVWESMTKFSDKPDPRALTGLGDLYNYGLGVPKKIKTALYYYKSAAALGNASAQFNLGQIYRQGKGVSQNHKTGVKWYRLSAEQGNAYGQNNLGFMYQNGLGVTQDYKTAVKWYKLGAEQGNADAQINLGFMYDTGRGVIQDNVYAHMWYNIAASSGEKIARENKDIIVTKMTPAEISTAQKLARECVRKKYKGC